MNFAQEAKALSPYIQGIRETIHRHGELSLQEKRTTAFLQKELQAIGIETETFPDFCGCIGTIRGGRPGRTVMLRSDIDALPIEEKTGATFASEVPGVMHACGHDCHMAMLLGAAKLLYAHRESLCGTVKLIFQSAEEHGGGGMYIAGHHLGGIDAAFGMHMSANIPKGTINIEEGPRMSANTFFALTIRGASAHGSTPHLGRDAIVAASAIIMNLQTIASRANDPLQPFVVSIGSVRAGSQFNIIADKVILEGTIRSFDPVMDERAPHLVQHIAEATAEALGCTAEYEAHSHVPVTANTTPALTETARKAAASLFGEAILAHQEPMMASEDFAAIMARVPAVFAFLGARDEEAGMTWPLHSDHFCPDGRILYRGAALHAQFAHDYLAKEAQ